MLSTRPIYVRGLSTYEALASASLPTSASLSLSLSPIYLRGPRIIPTSASLSLSTPPLYVRALSTYEALASCYVGVGGAGFHRILHHAAPYLMPVS